MINRYTRPEMGAIWELQNKFSIWKEIEILARQDLDFLPDGNRDPGVRGTG